LFQNERKWVVEKKVGDRRVARTRHMLRDALFTLIEERGYDTLSIQDITEQANIGRATFYVHYQDKEQLLLASVRELLEDMHAHMPLISTTDLLEKQQSLSVFVFLHVAEHAQVYRALLNELGSSLVMVRLREDTADRVNALITGLLAEAKEPLPLDLLTSYCAASLWSLVKWWLKNDFPLPAEEMGHLYWKLINQGLVKTLAIL
jgi:AcrR family transcriptional regulator